MPSFPSEARQGRCASAQDQGRVAQQLLSFYINTIWVFFPVDPKVRPAPGVNLLLAKALAAPFYTAGLFINPMVIAFPRHLLGCV